MTGGLQERIASTLGRGAATAPEISDALASPISNVRNTLAAMYFCDGTVGCDAGGRFHLASATSNGVTVVRHVGGRDVVA